MNYKLKDLIKASYTQKVELFEIYPDIIKTIK